MKISAQRQRVLAVLRLLVIPLCTACTDEPKADARSLPTSVVRRTAPAETPAETTADTPPNETVALPNIELVPDPNKSTPLSLALYVDGAGSSTIRADVSGETSFSIDFAAPADGRALPLVGFKPNQLYQIQIRVIDPATESVRDVGTPWEVTAADLPDPFPTLDLLRSDVEAMQPGHTLFPVSKSNELLVIVDELGEVVWYYQAEDALHDCRQLPNGNLLFTEGGSILEMTLLGDVVRKLPVAQKSFIDYHHEAYPTNEGTYLSIAMHIGEVDGFRTSYEDPTQVATVEVTDDVLVEVDANGEVLSARHMVDVLDRGRLGNDSLSDHPAFGSANDWTHMNAIVPVDDGQSVLVSSRHQDAVVKLSRDFTEIRWILANPTGWSEAFRPYLFSPDLEADPGFAWPYHQHAPELTPDGTLLIFDNGNHRASPGDGRIPDHSGNAHSRVVEYRIDEEQKTITTAWKWEYPDARLYTFAVGDADLSEANTVLVTYGMLFDVGDQSSADLGRAGPHARLVEVNRDLDDSIVFELDVYDEDPEGEGWWIYRAERIDPIR